LFDGETSSFILRDDPLQSRGNLDIMARGHWYSTSWMLRKLDGDASSVREDGGTSLGTGLRPVGVVSDAPHGSRQLEQFLEEVEFEILAMLKRGNEDFAPSPRSKAVNGLLANLQGQDQVVVPTGKTNSFRFDSKDYIRWVKARLNASAKVVFRQHLMAVLQSGQDLLDEMGSMMGEKEVKFVKQSLFSLENFVSHHRNAFVSMQACAQHVQYQIPNEHSRVGFLLDAIQCSDAGLQAAMASVRTDNGPQGMRNNFENTASHLLPYDPMARKRIATHKRDNLLISGVEREVSVFNMTKKPGIGKTGVHFRFYKKPEHEKLSDEQKVELNEWRENNPDAVKRGKQEKIKGKEDKKRLYSNKEIASLVSKKEKLAL
jgi:hypothetical protein